MSAWWRGGIEWWRGMVAWWCRGGGSHSLSERTYEANETGSSVDQPRRGRGVAAIEGTGHYPQVNEQTL